MVVRDGYKQTEVGVLPIDWEVKTLGECLIKTPDYGINAAAVDYNDNLPTYLRITDISEDGKYISSNKVSVNNIQSNSYYLEDGDIVFARTGASVGKTYLYDKNDGMLVFAGFLIRAKSNPKILDNKYLLFSTQTKYYWSWVLANSMRSGQPGLNSNEYKSFQISLPPTVAEQTAIAAVLSDADGLITRLEKLIAKKRNIKQGAMQQLLQPKEGWEVKKLGGILKNTQLGGNYPNSEKISNSPLIKMGNIQRGYISISKIEYILDHYKPEERDRLKYGDVLFNTRNTLELVGKVSVWRDELPKAYFNSNLMRFEFNSEFVSSNFFMNYLLNTKDSIAKLKDIATGTTSVAAIYTKDLLKIEIPLPSLDEQTRTATILSDMDAELTALEQKLEKYKKIKLGMMQELLTGKTRLI